MSVFVYPFLILCNIFQGLQKWNIFSTWKGRANKCIVIQIVHNSYNEAKCNSHSSDFSKINYFEKCYGSVRMG